MKSCTPMGMAHRGWWPIHWFSMANSSPQRAWSSPIDYKSGVKLFIQIYRHEPFAGSGHPAIHAFCRERHGYISIFIECDQASCSAGRKEFVSQEAGRRLIKITLDIAHSRDQFMRNGVRHMRGLPVRGQRTRTNSRTRHGNVRKTAGSGRKKSSDKT